MRWTTQLIRPLAESFDERVRYDLSRFDRLLGPAEARGTVLRDPATEEDITRAEARLGVRLPPSYRAFLLVSNGAYASAGGAEIRGQEDWRHGLLPVDEIDTTTRADPIGVQVWCDELPAHNDPDTDFLPVAGDPKLVAYYAPYREGLVITHIQNGTDRLALVPRSGMEEWELWDFHWEGAFAHPSFADFLEWFVARPDRRPKPEDADRLVEQYESGTLFTLFDLAEIGDPRAVTLAQKAIAEGTADARIPELLGKLGDAANTAPLKQLFEQGHGAIRVGALMALEKLGAEDLHELLLVASDDDTELVRDWARRRLEAA